MLHFIKYHKPNIQFQDYYFLINQVAVITQVPIKVDPTPQFYLV